MPGTKTRYCLFFFFSGHNRPLTRFQNHEIRPLCFLIIRSVVLYKSYFSYNLWTWPVTELIILVPLEHWSLYNRSRKAIRGINTFRETWFEKINQFYCIASVGWDTITVRLRVPTIYPFHYFYKIFFVILIFSNNKNFLDILSVVKIQKLILVPLYSRSSTLKEISQMARSVNFASA